MKRLFFMPRGRRPLERAVRGLLVVGVFALAVVAYQNNFQRVIARVEAKGTVADPGGLLTEADRQWLLAQAAFLRARYGLELAVRIGSQDQPAGEFPAPDPDDPKKVFLYCDPDCQGSRATVPPLVASGLPPGFAADLGRAHLDAACRRGQVREGVLAAVGLLIDALGQAAHRAKGEDT
ncbi:TPM domain-containing protein [Solidesulfovibrio sp.]